MEVAGRDLSNIVALTHKLGLGSEWIVGQMLEKFRISLSEE